MSRIGTVCTHCWTSWGLPHDPKKCRDRWTAVDGSPVVCMCGCARAKTAKSKSPPDEDQAWAKTSRKARGEWLKENP